jgi:hypothetical protein
MKNTAIKGNRLEYGQKTFHEKIDVWIYVDQAGH